MPVFESEKEFEDLLMENTGILVEEFGGGEFFRQVDLFGYGVADIISIDSECFDEEDSLLMINIIELKVGKIGMDAIKQVCRYKRAVERYFSKEKDKGKYKNTIISVSATLIGSGVSQDGSCYVIDSIENLSAYSYKINPLSGLEFIDENDWFSKGEDFSNISLDVLRGIGKALRGSKDQYLCEKEQAGA